MPRLIDPTSDRPIYRQIADHLRAGIREGRYPEGTPLPSESQLAEIYDVTRMTARQAVDVLKNEGLVRSEHGRGVFVRQRPTVHRLARNRFTRQRRETGKGAYDVEMKELGFTPGVELVEVGPVTPPVEIVKRLHLEPGEQALIRRRRIRQRRADAARHLLPPLVPGRGHTDGRARHRTGRHLLPARRHRPRPSPVHRGARKKFLYNFKASLRAAASGGRPRPAIA